MKSTSFSYTASEPNSPVGTTSGWSVASWVFFGLVVLSSAYGCCWLFVRSTSDDPLATFSVDMARMVGMATAYWIAWAFALAGAVTGLIGVSKNCHRTNPAWIAVALNGTFWFVVTALLWIL